MTRCDAGTRRFVEFTWFDLAALANLGSCHVTFKLPFVTCQSLTFSASQRREEGGIELFSSQVFWILRGRTFCVAGCG